MPLRRKTRQQTIVVTRIAGRLGRLLARSLHREFQVIGIDARGARHMPKDVTVHPLDIRRKKAEDIFRRNRIDAVVHFNPEPEWHGGDREHRDLTLVGTHKILEFCQRYDVPKVILVSTAMVYGARPDNNQFLGEEAPLLASGTSGGMRDLIEVDMYANSFFWRHPEVDTVILRPVHIVGRLTNSASRYLRLRYTPTLLGFDPMVQLIAPEDVVSAIHLALKPGIRGVFNIAGPGCAPLSEIVRKLGHHRLPLPETVARSAIASLWGMGLSQVPSDHLDHLKYVCMVDDSHARDVLRYAPSRSLEQTLDPLRTAM